MEPGRLANEFPPRLRLVDPRGNRLDEVEFHPAYHALMARSMAAGLHCSIWDEARAPSKGAAGHAARAARVLMATQAKRRASPPVDDDQREHGPGKRRAGEIAQNCTHEEIRGRRR